MKKNSKKRNETGFGAGWALIIFQLLAYFGRAQSESLGKVFRISNSGEFFEFIGFNLIGIFGLIIIFKNYKKTKRMKQKSEGSKNFAEE